MDPVSFLLGFTRALTPPMAPPAPQSVVPKHATTNLGLDHDRLKAIYADSRVAAQPAQPAQPPAGGEGPAAQGGQPPQQAQQAQQVQQPSRVEEIDAVDAVDRAALIDPLMATRMMEIYADRLTLSAPACRPEVWRALDAPMPWSL